MRSSILTRLGIGLFALLAAFVFLVALLKAPTPTNDKTTLISGQVETIGSPCCEDVGIRLEGDRHFYYINRGVESGIDVYALSDRLRGEHISMRVIETRWSPLNPEKRSVPVAEISYNGEILYSSMVN
ncbi:MAG: hypothetical protein AB8G77_03405 [Rhodothermales bacterium]